MADLSTLIAAQESRLNRCATAAWLHVVESAGVPIGLTLSIAVVHVQAQTRAHYMVAEFEHPRAGPDKEIGVPHTLSAAPAKVGRPAPLDGAHAILGDVGFRPAEIDAVMDECMMAVGAANAGNP